MSSLSNHDRELQNYFTDVEYLREILSGTSRPDTISPIPEGIPLLMI